MKELKPCERVFGEKGMIAYFGICIWNMVLITAENFSDAHEWTDVRNSKVFRLKCDLRNFNEKN